MRNRLHLVMLAGVLALFMSTALPAQNANEIIRSTSNGVLWFGGNEVRTDAKDLDAAALRIGSPKVDGRHGGGGKIGFDAGIWPEHASDSDIQRARRVEVVGIGGSFNGRSGEMGIWVWNGRDVNDIRDADQPKAIEIRGNRGDGQGEVEFKMPVKFSAGVVGMGGVGGRVTRFYTDGGRYIINWQDDTGKPTGIIYDTHGTTNEAEWTAVGKIPIEYF